MVDQSVTIKSGPFLRTKSLRAANIESAILLAPPLAVLWLVEGPEFYRLSATILGALASIFIFSRRQFVWDLDWLPACMLSVLIVTFQASLNDDYYPWLLPILQGLVVGTFLSRPWGEKFKGLLGLIPLIGAGFVVVADYLWLFADKGQLMVSWAHGNSLVMVLLIISGVLYVIFRWHPLSFRFFLIFGLIMASLGAGFIGLGFQTLWPAPLIPIWLIVFLFFVVLPNAKQKTSFFLGGLFLVFLALAAYLAPLSGLNCVLSPFILTLGFALIKFRPNKWAVGKATFSAPNS
ncbi:MAG: hypothetical protein ACRCTY_10275, partial [Candidatus Adiutrix sp.]